MSSYLLQLARCRCPYETLKLTASTGMPPSISANLIGKHVKQAEVKIFEKAAHGMYLTHAEKVLEEVLAFVFGL